MTRFWITLTQAVDFVLTLLEHDAGRRGLRAQDPVDADHRPGRRASAPDCRSEIIGIRPGEKLHEILITADEARHRLDLGDRYVVMPQLMTSGYDHGEHGTRLPDDSASPRRQ